MGSSIIYKGADDDKQTKTEIKYLNTHTHYRSEVANQIGFLGWIGSGLDSDYGLWIIFRVLQGGK